MWRVMKRGGLEQYVRRHNTKEKGAKNKFSVA